MFDRALFAVLPRQGVIIRRCIEQSLFTAALIGGSDGFPTVGAGDAGAVGKATVVFQIVSVVAHRTYSAGTLGAACRAAVGSVG